MSKITSIQQQQKRKHRYSVYIDDEFAFGVDEDVVIKYSLKKGMEVDDNFMESIVKAEEQVKANNYALNLLSYRARSKKEIIDKMKQYGYEDNNIEITIEMLEKYEYINDYEFAKLLIKDKQNFKKAGKILLKQELFKKGIDKNIIEEVIRDNTDEESEYEMALELAKKKLNSSYKNDEKQAQYRKLYSLLQRKGYGGSLVGKVVKEVLGELEE